MTKSLSGQCLCGSVKFTATGEITRVTACHCQQCRRQNGGGAFHSLEIKGEIDLIEYATLSWFTSSDWAERGFCNQCGTSLFWKLKREGSHYDISLGALDDTSGIDLQAHIFADDKGSYETLSDDIPHMTGAEVLAAFSGSDS